MTELDNSNTSASAASDTGSPWRGAGPELMIAAVAVTVTGAAALAVAGWPGLVAVAAGTAVISVLVVMFGLAPQSAPDASRTAPTRQHARSLSGYSQRRFVVAMSVRDRGFYESDLRPALEHLLAARLAQRRGINLYTEPEAARKAFCAAPRDEALWRWIDPARERRPVRGGPGSASGNQGIPRRDLTRLVHRLENL